MPQFTCQHPGCGTVFAANPGSLDRYFSHIERHPKAEADAGIPPLQRHSYEADEKALAIKPNPTTSLRVLKMKCRSGWPG